MLFRKPNRRATSYRKSNQIPAVESVEDRVLLSATCSPAVDMTDMTNIDDRATVAASDMNESYAGSEEGPHRQRHDRHHDHHGEQRRGRDRLNSKDSVTDETTDEIVGETVVKTTEVTTDSIDAVDATTEVNEVGDQTTDEAADSFGTDGHTTDATGSESDEVVDTVENLETILTSVGGTDTGNEAASSWIDTASSALEYDSSVDVVINWNNLFGEVLPSSIVNQNPGYASRSMAILNLAIYDAVAVAQGGSNAETFYEYDLDAISGHVSSEAAASQAAYTVLSSLYPDQQAVLDAFLESSPAVSGSNGTAASAALGTAIADEILTIRANDGWDAIVEYTYTDEIGSFEADPLNPDVPVWGPGWGEVDTFVIASTDDYLPETTPALTSEEYAASYNEVLELGSADSTERTADQTEIGIFWAYDREGLGTPLSLYNDVLITIAIQEGNSLEENAALFAQASVAMADAAIVAWDTKFSEDFWRPITAIQEGDLDGNPLTEGDAEWTALGAPDGGDDEIGFTPQFPTYISGHATFGGALFGTLQEFYGTDDISFELTSKELEILLDDPELQEAYGLDLEDATRSFDSFSEAMAENGRSRVYLGIHFDFDDLVGQEVGQAVAAAVAAEFVVTTSVPTVMRIDLAETGASDVTVLTADGNLEVVDNRTAKVISSQSLDSVERLILTSSDSGSQRVAIEGISSAELPGGLIVEAGEGRADTLIVSGTGESDTIVVNDGYVDVNGMQMEFTGVERIVIQGTDVDDTIEIAGGLDIDVEVRDTIDNDRMQDGRHGRDRLARDGGNQRRMRGPSRSAADGASGNAAAGSGATNRILDHFFASGDLNQILSMSPDQRRR